MNMNTESVLEFIEFRCMTDIYMDMDLSAPSGLMVGAT